MSPSAGPDEQVNSGHKPLSERLRDIDKDLSSLKTSSALWKGWVVVAPLLGAVFGWAGGCVAEARQDEERAEAAATNAIERLEQLHSQMKLTVDMNAKIEEYRTTFEHARDDAQEASGESKEALRVAREYRDDAERLIQRSIEAEVLVEKMEGAASNLEDAGEDLVNRLLAEDSSLRSELAVEAASVLAGRDTASVPVGGIIAWPGKLPTNTGEWKLPSELDLGETWVPLTRGDGSKWCVCDGRTYDVGGLDGNELYQAIGNLYGALSGSSGTEVRLPNFEGMFLRGYGEEAQYKSEELGARQDDAVGEHRHPFNHRTLPQDIPGDNGVNYAMVNYGVKGAESVVSIQSDKTIPPPIGATENIPVNYAVHWIIRVE